MSGWTWAWLLWLAAFVVLETITLVRKAPDDTLSEHIWRWFAIGRPGDRPKMSPLVQLRRVLLVASLAWLAAHFLTGGLV